MKTRPYSYFKFTKIAAIIDLSISLFLSGILLLVNTDNYINNKYFILPIISIIATVFVSFGLIFNDRNIESKINTFSISVMFPIMIIFNLIILILSFNDYKLLSVFIVTKFMVSITITLFIPKKLTTIELTNKDVKSKK